MSSGRTDACKLAWVAGFNKWAHKCKMFCRPFDPPPGYHWTVSKYPHENCFYELEWGPDHSDVGEA